LPEEDRGRKTPSRPEGDTSRSLPGIDQMRAREARKTARKPCKAPFGYLDLPRKEKSLLRRSRNAGKRLFAGQGELEPALAPDSLRVRMQRKERIGEAALPLLRERSGFKLLQRKFPSDFRRELTHPSWLRKAVTETVRVASGGQL
jgi:hypothetical protein